jgi:hypothetical protein
MYVKGRIILNEHQRKNHSKFSSKEEPLQMCVKGRTFDGCTAHGGLQMIKASLPRCYATAVQQLGLSWKWRWLEK